MLGQVHVTRKGAQKNRLRSDRLAEGFADRAGVRGDRLVAVKAVFLREGVFDAH